MDIFFIVDRINEAGQIEMVYICEENICINALISRCGTLFIYN